MSGAPIGGRPAEGDEPLRLSFPDAPRLELDQLLDQLVQRAQEVMGTQGRLRSLLLANRMIRGLEQPEILAHAVRAARDLVGARYAAIGVAGPSGGLAEFVHSGLDAATVARIGEPPQGKGLLGAVLDERAPLRLARLADDPRSAGLPLDYPSMEGFLGVPIRVRGELFGAFYLSCPTSGEFTAEDQELLGAFASSVGDAIDHARLYEASRARGEWLAASAAVTRQLLSADEDGPDPLHLVAERMQEIAGADLVLVLRPAGPDGSELAIEVSVGADAGQLRGRTLPVETSLSGRVFTSGEPARLAHLTDGTGLSALTSGEVELGPVLAVPLVGSRQVHGVLAAARLVGRAGFTDDDVDMAASFANHAALAVELAEARAQQQLNSLLSERERIAVELHDHVVQQLFGTGLSLQGLAATAGTSPFGTRLTAAVHDLDRVIGQIRSTVFQLQSQPHSPGQGVRDRLLDVLAELRPALGFDPGLRFSGLLEDLPPDLVEDLVAVLHEALADVAEHAGATTADVEVHVAAGRVALRVTDDGRASGTYPDGGGLAAVRHRAEARGGTFDLSAAHPHGTRLSWTVPSG
jgi:signal transduction histidine kinase